MRLVRMGQRALDNGELIAGLFLVDEREATNCHRWLNASLALGFGCRDPEQNFAAYYFYTFAPNHRECKRPDLRAYAGISGKCYFIDSRERVKVAGVPWGTAIVRASGAPAGS